MSARAGRFAFALVFVFIATSIVSALVFVPTPNVVPLWLGGAAEIVVLICGGALALGDPPAGYRAPARLSTIEPPAPTPASVYRGAQAPASAPLAITKESAQRLTIGVLAALAFTAAAVPFAVHLPRWIEAELVVGAWWAVWSVVLGVVAYRGSRVDDDHRPGRGRIAEPTGSDSPKWTWLFHGVSDGEGCLFALAILAIVGVALLGAWLVVELVAPAVFIVAYRTVVRALAKAHAANTRGDVLRSALAGMGWAAFGTLPLALVVVIVHQIAVTRAS
jgi:hypothetical protein